MKLSTSSVQIIEGYGPFGNMNLLNLLIPRTTSILFHSTAAPVTQI